MKPLLPKDFCIALKIPGIDRPHFDEFACGIGLQLMQLHCRPSSRRPSCVHQNKKAFGTLFSSQIALQFLRYVLKHLPVIFSSCAGGSSVFSQGSQCLIGVLIGAWNERIKVGCGLHRRCRPRDSATENRFSHLQRCI